MSRNPFLFIFPYLTAASLAVAPKATASEAWVYDTGQGDGLATFIAVGKPKFFVLRGRSGTPPAGVLRVDDKNHVSGTLTFDLATLGTGIPLRDRHLKFRYLEIDKFPDARLTITELTLPNGFGSEGFTAQNVPFKAVFLIHGIEKPVEGRFSFEHRAGGKMFVDVTFEISIADHAIKTPRYAGITIANRVDVNVKILAPFFKPM